VEGAVTLDGKPLSEAAVLFVPLGVDRKKTGAAIQAGWYQLPAADGLLPGRYRVEVIDNPPLRRAEPGPGRRRHFPYQYAHDSPLEIDVPADTGRGVILTFDFVLKSEAH
jgi:hypothetical protein